MADKKIEPCPYCKNECYATDSITLPAYRCWVACNSCHYRSVDKPTKAEAIAAHNKVSNAVATQPDLLDALEGLEDDWGADDCMCELPDICSICVARAAVLKAKGKSHG